MESQAVDDSSECIRIGAVAQQAGMSIKTIRFYSDEGLVPVAGRTQGGYRLYHQHVVEELQLIQNLRGLGLPLGTIRNYLAAKREGACHCEQLKQSMREQKQAIHQRIAVLQNLQQELSETMEGWVNCGGRLDATLM